MAKFMFSLPDTGLLKLDGDELKKLIEEKEKDKMDKMAKFMFSLPDNGRLQLDND